MDTLYFSQKKGSCVIRWARLDSDFSLNLYEAELVGLLHNRIEYQEGYRMLPRLTRSSFMDTVWL